MDRPAVEGGRIAISFNDISRKRPLELAHAIPATICSLLLGVLTLVAVNTTPRPICCDLRANVCPREAQVWGEHRVPVIYRKTGRPRWVARPVPRGCA